MRAPIWTLTIALAAGCTNATSSTPQDNPDTVHHALGEANTAVWFHGEGAEDMPSYDERVAWWMLNSVRMHTDVYEIVDADDNAVLPMPPLIHQPGMTETGRWQGAHALANDCLCIPDPMSGTPVEAEAGFSPFTCCTVGYVDGTMACVGPQVACGEEGMTPAASRWGLLNKGAGEVRNELFFITADPALQSGLGAADFVLQAALGLVLGPLDGSGAAARVTIEDRPDEVYWSVFTGRSTDPTPVLNDVIHLGMEEGGNIFTLHYYDPAGDPTALSIVTDTACLAMGRTFERPSEAPDAEPDEDFPYVGNTYEVGAPASGTCVRYVAHAQTAEGFDHVYPTFGSLGMQLQGGQIVPNDETCPIWVPDSRPAPSCLPAATECTNGATRLCYTGRAGTEDKGICDVGSETCENGRWSGLCVGEVRPEAADSCDDGLDNNCNGFVDEGCDAPVLPVPEPEPEPEPEPGTNGGEQPTPAPPTDDDDGCCATVAPSQSGEAGLLLAALFGAVAVRRKKIVR